jgi:hypothetical protein
MNRLMSILMVISMFLVAGCSLDKGKELYDTAQFEEKQHNSEHACQLYEELVKKFPGTEFADKASQRLQILKR